jgi:hypothetical protein
MQFHSWHYQQLAGESNINNAKGKALLKATTKENDIQRVPSE